MAGLAAALTALCGEAYMTPDRDVGFGLTPVGRVTARRRAVIASVFVGNAVLIIWSCAIASIWMPSAALGLPATVLLLVTYAVMGAGTAELACRIDRSQRLAHRATETLRGPAGELGSVLLVNGLAGSGRVSSARRARGLITRFADDRQLTLVAVTTDERLSAQYERLGGFVVADAADGSRTTLVRSPRPVDQRRTNGP